MKRILFFTSPGDIASILAKIDELSSVSYFPRGGFPKGQQPAYDRSAEIPNLGLANGDQMLMCDKFVISRKGKEIHYSQFGGATGLLNHFAIIPGENRDTLELFPGGLRPSGTLLHGELATLYDSPFPQAIVRRFLSALKSTGAEKVRHWWVGKEALQMLKDGRRLATGSERATPELDLKLER